VSRRSLLKRKMNRLLDDHFVVAEISDIPIKWTRDLTLKRLSTMTDEPSTPPLSEAPRLQNTNTQNPSSHLSRSVTVAGDRTQAVRGRPFHYNTPQEDVEKEQATAETSSVTTVRTFAGWKRDSTQSDKAHLSKGSMRPHVS
jgi:hypothetical protein